VSDAAVTTASSLTSGRRDNGNAGIVIEPDELKTLQPVAALVVEIWRDLFAPTFPKSPQFALFEFDEKASKANNYQCSGM